MNKKLTATMLIAMAAKQGIQLVEADGATQASPADASLLAMREKRANDAERGMERAIIEANGLRKELDAAQASLANLKGWSGAKALSDCRGELAEARAEVASLQRTVSKLRVAALQTPAALAPTVVDEAGATLVDPLSQTVADMRAEAGEPRMAGLPIPRGKEACERCGKLVKEGSLFHDDDTEMAVCGECPKPDSGILPGDVEPSAQVERDNMARMANRTQVATAGGSLRVTFQGPQGFGTADKLKAHGARWKVTSRKGEPMRGYWLMPESREALETVKALRQAGKLFTVEMVHPSDATGPSDARGPVRDPGEDAADRFHDRIDRQ